MVKKEKKVTSKKEDKVTKKEVKKDKKVAKKKEISITNSKNELKKIKWPTKNEMVKYSIATIIFIVFFAIFFGLIILLMSFIKQNI